MEKKDDKKPTESKKRRLLTSFFSVEEKSAIGEGEYIAKRVKTVKD